MNTELKIGDVVAIYLDYKNSKNSQGSAELVEHLKDEESFLEDVEILEATINAIEFSVVKKENPLSIELINVLLKTSDLTGNQERNMLNYKLLHKTIDSYRKKYEKHLSGFKHMLDNITNDQFIKYSYYKKFKCNEYIFTGELWRVKFKQTKVTVDPYVPTTYVTKKYIRKLIGIGFSKV